jgi:hypothetical protein
MMRKRNEIEERRVEQLLARLWRRVPTPAEHELRTMARSAAAEPRPLEQIGSDSFSPSRWRLRLRWTVAAAAVALLVGSGLGFGLGSSLTPSGSAGTDFVGLGFLPARGWTVVQSGTPSSTDAARAIAANVPLHPNDDLGDTPYATLESLPPDGILILATFTTRGDPGEDFKFEVGRLPLQISGAKPVSPASDPLRFARDLAQYRLRAGVGGSNVDIRIYFGTGPPAAKMTGVAQRQLNRLVVASERVTILARPSVVPWGIPVTLFGSVDNGKAGEVVDIQAKDCGSSSQFFRGVAGTTTHEGGSWSTEYFPGITSTLRAVSNDAASAQITVWQRPFVQLRKRSARGFEVGVRAKRQFWHKQVLFQRFDRRLGTWTNERSVVLTEQTASGQGFISTAAEFRASVAKGSLVRAVFPLSQARPCYLAGVSNTLRT